MSELFTTLTVIFVASSVMIFLLDRFQHPSIPAYIIAGIFISRYIPESTALELSQFGIAFLIFIFGIKTDIDRIKSVAEESITTAIASGVLVGAVAFIVAEGFGFSQLNAFYLSIAAALSSSLVGLELVESEVRTDVIHGRLAEGIQLVQDLFALVIIAVIGLQLSPSDVALKLSHLAGIILLSLGIRQFLFDKIAEFTEGSRELLTLTALSFLTLFIAVSGSLDSSIVIGSFAAGLAVARFPYNIEILDTMGSLKDFFSAIFFVTLGSLITVPSTETAFLILVLLSVTVLLKPLATALSLMIAGYDRRTSYLVGLSLDQVSEFALIIAIQAHITGTIAPEIFQAVIVSATASMIISSYTSRYEEEIYSQLSRIGILEVNQRKINQKTLLPEEISDHVILLGYHRQGKEISEALKQENADFLVIENDPEKIEEAIKNEDHYIFGDAMDSETWRKARFKEASLIVSTVPFRSVSEKILSLETEADKIVRSREVYEAEEMLEKGATYVSVPDILSSEELLDHLEGVLENVNYREELRRRNLLEIRQYLQNEE